MRFFLFLFAAGALVFAACTTDDGGESVDLSSIEARLTDLERAIEQLNEDVQREDCISFAEFQELSAYQEYLADISTYESYERVHAQYEDLVDACAKAFGDPSTSAPTSLDDYLDWVEQQPD